MLALAGERWDGILGLGCLVVQTLGLFLTFRLRFISFSKAFWNAAAPAVRARVRRSIAKLASLAVLAIDSWNSLILSKSSGVGRFVGLFGIAFDTRVGAIWGA